MSPSQGRLPSCVCVLYNHLLHPKSSFSKTKFIAQACPSSWMSCSEQWHGQPQKPGSSSPTLSYPTSSQTLISITLDPSTYSIRPLFSSLCPQLPHLSSGTQGSCRLPNGLPALLQPNLHLGWGGLLKIYAYDAFLSKPTSTHTRLPGKPTLSIMVSKTLWSRGLRALCSPPSRPCLCVVCASRSEPSLSATELAGSHPRVSSPTFFSRLAWPGPSSTAHCGCFSRLPLPRPGAQGPSPLHSLFFSSARCHHTRL